MSAHRLLVRETSCSRLSLNQPDSNAEPPSIGVGGTSRHSPGLAPGAGGVAGARETGGDGVLWSPRPPPRPGPRGPQSHGCPALPQWPGPSARVGTCARRPRPRAGLGPPQGGAQAPAPASQPLHLPSRAPRLGLRGAVCSPPSSPPVPTAFVPSSRAPLLKSGFRTLVTRSTRGPGHGAEGGAAKALSRSRVWSHCSRTAAGRRRRGRPAGPGREGLLSWPAQAPPTSPRGLRQAGSGPHFRGCWVHVAARHMARNGGSGSPHQACGDPDPVSPRAGPALRQRALCWRPHSWSWVQPDLDP